MSQPEVQLIRKSDFIVDIVIVGAFFAFMFFQVLPSHVPSTDPTMITLWSAGAAACMSGVFWLASWMFRVVYRYEKVLTARK
jgi:hypothetical protein